MSAKSRDEFAERVKRTVAERAAYICANPACRRPTVGPHSDPDKSLKTGEACHIRAAAPGGPRYSPEQTGPERSAIENAIWLCCECSALIDKDAASYSAEVLLDWKHTQESWIRNGGIVPSLPEISLTTIKGRTLPEVPTTITLSDCTDTREHFLRIRNGADARITMVEAYVQLPEPIIESFRRHIPVGINVGWRPNRPQMAALIKGGGTVARTGAPFPTNVYHLQIDRLPPSHYVELGFITSTKVFEEHDLSFDRGPFEGTNEPPYVRNFINGTFQFDYQGAVLTKRFFAPIREDKQNRQLSVSEIREDFGVWIPLELTLFS